jgi:hypothetical protein
MKKNAKKNGANTTAVHFDFSPKYEERTIQRKVPPRNDLRFTFRIGPKRVQKDTSVRRVKITDVRIPEPTLERAYEEVTAPGGAAHPPLLHESHGRSFSEWHRLFGWLGHTGKAIQTFLREMEGWPGTKKINKGPNA